LPRLLPPTLFPYTTLFRSSNDHLLWSFFRGERKLIYFDNSATTAVYPAALETYDKVTKDIWGNPSSLHKMGDRSHQLLEASRKQDRKSTRLNSSHVSISYA